MTTWKLTIHLCDFKTRGDLDEYQETVAKAIAAIPRPSSWTWPVIYEVSEMPSKLEFGDHHQDPTP